MMSIEKVYKKRFSYKKKIYRKVLPKYFRSFFQKLRGKSFYKSYFDRYKCIFIHIPKSAGQSVSESLFGDRHPGHWSLRDYEWEDCEKVQNYFTFCIVRDPYARLLSAYNYLMNNTKSEIDLYFVSKVLHRYSTFEEFVKKGLKNQEVRSYIHFVPQIEFLKDSSGNVAIDYIGRLESLPDDYRYICDCLGVRISPLKKINSSESMDYMKLYDEEMKLIVQGVYEEDFLFLGYAK